MGVVPTPWVSGEDRQGRRAPGAGGIGEGAAGPVGGPDQALGPCPVEGGSGNLGWTGTRLLSRGVRDMADQRTEQKSDYRAAPGPAVSSAPGPITASPEMAGWVRFGAVVMMVVGVFGVIEGLSTMWWAPTYFV